MAYLYVYVYVYTYIHVTYLLWVKLLMEATRLTSWYVKHLIIHKGLYIPGGCLGYLPSTDHHLLKHSLFDLFGSLNHHQNSRQVWMLLKLIPSACSIWASWTLGVEKGCGVYPIPTSSQLVKYRLISLYRSWWGLVDSRPPVFVSIVLVYVCLCYQKRTSWLMAWIKIVVYLQAILRYIILAAGDSFGTLTVTVKETPIRQKLPIMNDLQYFRRNISR